MSAYLGIFLVSAATLLLELALLRIFAVQQFYHFAFMAISLALLGAGASGSLLSIWRRRSAPSHLSLAFTGTTVLAYWLINTSPFDSFSIAWDSRQIAYLAVYFLAPALPFFFSGLLVGGELIAAGDEGGGGSHRVYSANLIGSACGSLGSLLALATLGGPGTVVLAATMGAAAALVFLSGRQALHPRTGWALTAITSTIAVLLGVLALLRPPEFLDQNLSPYKSLSTLLLSLDSRQTFSTTNATARVDVVESPVIHVMPGLSLSSTAGLPEQAGLLIDGDNLMPISRLSAEEEQAQLLASNLPLAAAYRLRPGAETLVLNAGTGQDVLMALALGATRVTAVEENASIIRAVRQAYAAWTDGLYVDPRVMVFNQTGRVYARQAQPGSFGIVILALNDPHRPVTSGAYSLTEEYAYTVEAFEEYLQLLNQDGLLVITRWLQTPPSESARTFATLVEALQNTGHQPAQNLLAFRTLRTMTLIASPRPYSPRELQALRVLLDELNFDAVYMPGISSADVNRHNILPEASYFELFQRLLSAPQETYSAYRYEIRPPTDNHPFFFHFFKWRQTPEILAGLGQTWQPFGGSGFFVLAALLLLVTAAAALFIVVPLLIWRRGQKTPVTGVLFWRARVLLYFASLGIAFLFVEMPLAQRFILLLGQPVTALAVILFAILLFSGIGSWTSRRWPLGLALALLVLVVGLYPLLLERLSSIALRWPDAVRFLLSIVALAPLGYLMGIPFAGGLQLVEQRSPALVPWAWAINGSFSVISSVLAVMVALTWNFAVVLWLGAAAYALAWLAFARLAHETSQAGV